MLQLSPRICLHFHSVANFCRHQQSCAASVNLWYIERPVGEECRERSHFEMDLRSPSRATCMTMKWHESWWENCLAQLKVSAACRRTCPNKWLEDASGLETCKMRPASAFSWRAGSEMWCGRSRAAWRQRILFRFCCWILMPRESVNITKSERLCVAFFNCMRELRLGTRK